MSPVQFFVPGHRDLDIPVGALRKEPSPCFDVQIKVGIGHKELIVAITMPGTALNGRQP